MELVKLGGRRGKVKATALLGHLHAVAPQFQTYICPLRHYTP
jgi:hypothetical protein